MIRYTSLQKSILIIGLILIFVVPKARCQLNSDFPCYAISYNNGSDNTLYRYVVGTDNWDMVGNTMASEIKAMALDPYNEVIYACNGALFGIIDTQTADFTPVGLVGLAQAGIYGVQLFDEIVGLTYDYNNKILYAVERMNNSNVRRNDVLFQIDPATGMFIPGAFTDENGNPVDYVRIDHIRDGTEEEKIVNVEGIALHPQTGEMFVAHDQDSPAKISVIDPASGNLLQVLIDVNPADVSALTFTDYGFLYGTTVRNARYGSYEGIALVDYYFGFNEFFNPVDTVNTNFRAIDCYTISPGCFDSLNLDSSALFKNTYKSKTNINITETLSANSEVTLQAGTQVNLNMNFEVPNSSSFTAKIESCN